MGFHIELNITTDSLYGNWHILAPGMGLISRP